jgi:beta-phosphoglucomutase-like phosphatase (HAD superfamily)
VIELMKSARDAGLRMGIATTTSRANVEALLAMLLGEGWRTWFDVLVCGEDVRMKKPDPEAYLRALDALDLSPLRAVAIEDSPGGVAAARAAGIPVVVTRSSYFADAVIDDAIAIGPGLDRRDGWRPALPPTAAREAMVSLADIGQWLEQMDSVSQHA